MIPVTFSWFLLRDYEIFPSSTPLDTKIKNMVVFPFIMASTFNIYFSCRCVYILQLKNLFYSTFFSVCHREIFSDVRYQTCIGFQI